MSSPDFPLLDFFNQRIKRKLEDYDDDDLSYDLPFVRLRKDEPDLNFPPATASSFPFIDQNPSQLPYFQPRASTSGSTQEAVYSSHHNRIQFFVRMISEGKTLVFHGKPDDKIKAIHEKIQAITGIPMMEQRLIYCGRQLQWEHSLDECMILKDSGLHLVGRMRSTEHPKVWQLIDDMVSKIYRLCKGELGVCLNSVKSSVIDFVNMTKNDDVGEEHPSAHLNIFQSLCGPSALVMLYMSAHPGNKECAEESIRHLVESSKTMPKHLSSQCAPIMLDLCKLLGRGTEHHDPLYCLCRSSLGSIVEDLSIGRSLRTYESSSNKAVFIAFEDIYPYVTELASELSEGLILSDKSVGNGCPSPSDVRDFAAFLKPIRAAIRDQPDFGGVIPMPICYTLPFYGNEIRQLFMVFIDLINKMKMCLDRMKNELKKEPKRNGGWEWDQYLSILKELCGIAKLYESTENYFWEEIKRFKSELCYLVVRYATRGEDNEWILARKDLLDFESRRHLVMTLLPEMKDDYEELHEMLIDRSQLLAESFEYIEHADPETLRSGLFMEFKNEEATGPGVLREWFFMVCQEIFNPQNALFVACPNDRRRFFPNPASKVDPLHLEYFNFAGRVTALALMHKVQVGIVFDRVFFLQLAGSEISLEDIKDADPYLYSSCKQILDMDPFTVDQDVLGLTFVHEIEELGSMKVVELFPNGKNIIVNSRNRKEYVELLIQHRFVTSVAEQVKHFAQGFADIAGEEKPQQLFFKSLELEDLDGMLYGSESGISVSDWKEHTEYSGYKETDPQIYWFWKIVEEMSENQRKALLFFWTSLKHIPVEGFKGLSSKLYIYKSINSVDHLPSAHTCFHRICFPPYRSMGMMKDRLNIITQDHVGCSFGSS